MKNLKYKESKSISDEDILKFKDFNTVLSKQEAIASSYAKVVKIWGTIGLASVVVLVSFFTLKNTEENIAETTSITTDSSITLVQNTTEISAPITTPTVTIQPVAQPVSKDSKPKHKSTPVAIVPKDTSTMEETPVADAVVNSKEKPVNKYGFNFKTEEEKIHLPSVFVGGLRWPESISKDQLVLQSNLAVKYNGVAQEVPIVNYSVFHYKNGNLDNKPTKITVREGKFSAKLLQQMHRAKVGDVLVYKNITVYIPGIGVTNLGDMKVLIDSEKSYNRRINSRLE